MASVTSAVGIALSLEEEAEFAAAAERVVAHIQEIFAKADFSAGTAKSVAVAEKAEQAAAAAAARTTAKLAAEEDRRSAKAAEAAAKMAAKLVEEEAMRVGAAERAARDIADSDKRYNDIKIEYSKKGTQALLDDLKEWEDKSAQATNAVNAARLRGDKEAAAINQKAKSEILDQTRLMRQLAKDTEEVQHLGEGARSGILGVGRNLIFGVGEYTGQLKKLEGEQKLIGQHMEEADKKEMAAREEIQKAYQRKEKGNIEEAEFEEITSMKRLELAEAESLKKRLVEHTATIKKEIAETKELNEQSAEKSEGGLLGKLTGGMNAGMVGTAGLTAGLGMLFEKGMKVREEMEKTTIALRGQGLSEEEATEKTKKFADSARDVAYALGKSHDEVMAGTNAFLSFGGKAKDMASAQEDIAALAQKTGLSFEDAGKQMAMGLDPEIAKKLTKVGIALDANLSPEEKAIELHKKLAGTVEGMKDAADSGVGGFGRFKEMMSQLMEAGGLLLSAFVLPFISYVGKAASVVMDLVKPMVNLSQEGGIVGNVIKTISIVIGAAAVGFAVYSGALMLNTFLHGESAIAVGLTTAAKQLMNGTLIETAVAWVTETAASVAATVATVAQTVATAALGVAMAVLTSPITLVVVGIAALVAGVIYAYKHFEGFHNLVTNVGNFLKNVLWPIIEQGIEFWAKWLNPIGLAIQGFKLLYEKVEFFRNAVDATITVVKAAGEWIGELFGAEKKLTAEEEKAKDALEAKNKKIKEQNDLLAAAKKAQDNYYDSLKKSNDEIRQGADDIGSKQKELREALARNVRAYAAGHGSITKEQFEAAKKGIIDAYKSAQGELDTFNSGEETADKLLGIGDKDKSKVVKSAKSIAKTFSEQVSAFLGEEKNAVAIGVKMGGHSQEDSLEAIKLKLKSAEALQGEAAAKMIAAENANYAESRRVAGDNVAKLEQLAVDHEKKLAEIDSKGAADRIKGTAELNKAAFDLEKKIAEDAFKAKETEVKTREANGLVSKEKAAAEIELLQHDHYVRLISLDTQYNVDASDAQLALAQNEQKLREANWKAIETLVNTANSAELKLKEQGRKYIEDQQKAHQKAVLAAMKDGLDKQLALLDEKDREQIQSEKDKFKTILDDARSAMIAELALAIAKGESTITITAKYLQLQKQLSEEHDLRIADFHRENLEERNKTEQDYWMSKNGITKGGFSALHDATSQGLSWLESRWNFSANQQKTVLGQEAQSALNSLSGAIEEMIKLYEKKAIAFVLGQETESTASVTNAAVVTGSEATKKASFFATAGAALSGAATVIGSFVAMAASAVATGAVFVATQLASAASAIAGAVAAATMWLVSTLGPFGLIAAAGVIGGIVAGWSGIKHTLGFKMGGWTGEGDPNDAAGIVHKKEYVFDAASTERIGVGNLERIRSGGAIGGHVDLSGHTAAIVAEMRELRGAFKQQIIMDQRQNILSQSQEKQVMNTAKW